MQLTPDELVAEFHDAVMELYFARKRIVVLEAENAALRSQLATMERDSATEASPSSAPPGRS